MDRDFRESYTPGGVTKGMIPSGLKRLADSLGLEDAVLTSLLQRLWQLGSAPITLLLIASCFTSTVQGYYYLFTSLVALQVFVEMGLYLVIINVASHEWSSLSIDETGWLTGDPVAISRLGSLKRIILRWYVGGASLFVVLVGGLGTWFLQHGQGATAPASWREPWLAFVLFSGALLVTLPLISLLEGCNQVKSINRFRLGQSILVTLVLWSAIRAGLDLWSGVAVAGARLLTEILFLWIGYGRLLSAMNPGPPEHQVDWFREIWPMQWRVALSGVMSYFAFSLFSPVMFRYHGPEIAGRMGMTWSLVSVLQSLAFSWVQPRAPSFGIWLARGEVERLKGEWTRILWISVGVMAVSGALLCTLIAGLQSFRPDLAQRLLPVAPVAVFVLAAIVMQVSQCQAAFLRAHKEEPMAIVGVFTSLVIGLGVWLFGSRFGPMGAALSYLGAVILGTAWQSTIWYRYWVRSGR